MEIGNRLVGIKLDTGIADFMETGDRNRYRLRPIQSILCAKFRDICCPPITILDKYDRCFIIPAAKGISLQIKGYGNSRLAI
jgi:hypothetical protein